MGEQTVSPLRAGRNEPRPPAGRVSLPRRLRACLTAGANPGEREDVVGGRGEDRIAVVVLRRRKQWKYFVLYVDQRGPMKSGTIGSSWRQISRAALQRPLLLRVERHLPLVQEAGRLRVGSAPSSPCSSRPGRTACTFLRDVREEETVRRALRGGLPEQRRVLRADAFGYQEFQSGSSFTFELIPIAWRFFVMIWIEATQSDQPEITWMSRLTGLPFGSIRSMPL